MIFYLLYRLGHFFAVHFPLKFSYWIACIIADIHYYVSRRERSAVKGNLAVILGTSLGEARLRRMAREVFRNFAKYLVDFFRFSKIDRAYVERFVTIGGIEHLEAALKHGKGVIILSAHLGNWELGGFVLGSLGYPISAVVLTHQNKKINDFFIRQRSCADFASIELGPSLRRCYTVLKENKLLALLGDRDFSRNGLPVEFFGKSAILPKGPAVFSYRTGSAIVPGFITRNTDDTYTFLFEKPIFADTGIEEDRAVELVTKTYIPILESYIRQYPNQWYIFREFWNDHERPLRSNTIV